MTLSRGRLEEKRSYSRFPVTFLDLGRYDGGGELVCDFHALPHNDAGMHRHTVAVHIVEVETQHLVRQKLHFRCTCEYSSGIRSLATRIR